MSTSIIHGLAALTVAALCAAIGNPLAVRAGDDDVVRIAVETPAMRTAQAEAARQRAAAPGRALFMLSPFGPVAAPESLPDEPAMRTRNNLYATRQEADEMDAAAGGETVWIGVECCGAAALDQAYGIAVGIVAANDLADDVPVFVAGADLRQAAKLVDQLSDRGMTRVFLVTR